VIPKLLHEKFSSFFEDSEGYFLFTGGTATQEFDSWLADLKIKVRYPAAGSSQFMRELVNKREIGAVDLWLYEFSSWVSRGVISRKLKKIDLCIVEVTGIDENGVIPSLSVDASPAFLNKADKVILELNIARPSLKGLHDIYLPQVGKEIPISKPLDRIGSEYYTIPDSKIAAIVISEEEDSSRIHYSAVSQLDLKISENIIDFISKEIEEDENLKTEYFTLQPAAGPVAGALARKIKELNTKMYIWGEVAATSWLESLSYNVLGISAAVLYTLPGDENLRKNFYDNFEHYKKEVVLRPYEISNNPQVITRFYHVVVQQAIEVDIFGNANISHIGPNLYGGVGGSGDHTRPSYITILALPSTTSNGKISRIVPMVSHVDIPEHDVDILVTEQGWVDLRLLPPLERAKKIIEVCSHPNFKDKLLDYLRVIEEKTGHEPFDLKYASEFMSR